MGEFIVNLKQAQIFTPPHVANQMLDLLDQKTFKDSTVFFEPTCGNGNILLEIIERIYSEYEGTEEEIIAMILFKIFAIELDPELALEARCRTYAKINSLITPNIDYKKLSQYLIANLCNERISHQDFFKFMEGK